MTFTDVTRKFVVVPNILRQNPNSMLILIETDHIKDRT